MEVPPRLPRQFEYRSQAAEGRGSFSIDARSLAQIFSRKKSCSKLFKVVQSCSRLFKVVQGVDRYRPRSSEEEERGHNPLRFGDASMFDLTSPRGVTLFSARQH